MTEPPVPLVEEEEIKTEPSRTFILKLRYSFIIVTSLFLIGLFVGCFVPKEFMELVMGYVAGGIDPGNYSSLSTFFLILANNLRVILVALLLSPLVLISLFGALMNGLLITAVGVYVVAEYGLGFFLLGIIPHGIIEIPALIVAFSAALSFGITFDVNLFVKNGLRIAWPEMKFHLKVFLIAALAIPLAAIIETYITPMILGVA